MLGALGFTLILASLLLAYFAGRAGEIESREWDPDKWQASRLRHPSR